MWGIVALCVFRTNGIKKLLFSCSLGLGILGVLGMQLTKYKLVIARQLWLDSGYGGLFLCNMS